MKKEIKEYWDLLKEGTKLMFKEFFNKKTNKKQRANMWTFSRLITSFLIPICSIISIFTATPLLFIISFIIAGFGASTDFLDGRSAKKHNSYSEYGQVLDQIADKIFSIMLGINLSLFNPLYILELLGEGIIATTNIFYKIKFNNIEIKSTQIGRIKQWPLFTSLILGFISTLSPSTLIITNASIILTIIFQSATFISYIKNNNEIIKNIEKQKDNNLKMEQNQEIENKNSKVKTIDNKNSEISKDNDNFSKIKKYEELKNLINEIAIQKSNIDLLNKNGYQKTKK